MLATSAAASGYLQTKKSVGTPRSIEHEIFQKVTAKLKAAQATDASYSVVADAVHLNSKLWAALAIDLLDDANQLPEQLRASLVSLADFSRKHGTLVLSGMETVDPLIDVNVAVMRGLRGVVDR